MNKSTTLYYRNGTSDKVYQASLEEVNGGFVVNFSYGRRGSTLQCGTKTPTAASQSVAEAIYERILKEKMAKGYTPGEDGTPYAYTSKADQDTGIRPQLCNPIPRDEIERLMAGPHYWMQPKHDGRRLMIHKKEGEIIGINRKGLIVALPETLMADAAKAPVDFLIDGEAMGDRLIVFDLLFHKGKDLRQMPYLERHLHLMQLLSIWEARSILLSPIACTDGEKRKMFENLEAANAEGVVFKRIRSPYIADRPSTRGDWLKFKFQETASFVVSRVNEKRSVNLVLMAHGVAKNAGNVTIPANRAIPEIGQVVEVRYLYALAESGYIYQPVYLGVRDDIGQEKCTVDQLKYKAEAVGA